MINIGNNSNNGKLYESKYYKKPIPLFMIQVRKNSHHGKITFYFHWLVESDVKQKLVESNSLRKNPLTFSHGTITVLLQKVILFEFSLSACVEMQFFLLQIAIKVERKELINLITVYIESQCFFPNMLTEKFQFPHRKSSYQIKSAFLERKKLTLQLSIDNKFQIDGHKCKSLLI